MDISTGTLRVLREVAERGSFTAAATALGYSQSAVSRQVAVAEREVGGTLFQRSAAGVRPTAEGRIFLQSVFQALAALDAAHQQMQGLPIRRHPVRVGHVPIAGAGLVPRALVLLRERAPGLTVSTREGSTPALVRALRAGSLDLAVVTSRPPHRTLDQDVPPLAQSPLLDLELAVAVPAQGSLGRRSSVSARELAQEPWITSPAPHGEPALGVWPGLPGRPRVQHTATDWTTKLALVAAGTGVTTVAPALLNGPSPDVHVVKVDDVPSEVRRLLVARLPGHADAAVNAVLDVLHDVTEDLPT